MIYRSSDIDLHPCATEEALQVSAPNLMIMPMDIHGWLVLME